MPVDRGVHVALVLDVDDDLRALLHLQDRSGNRPVVGQHPDRRVAQSLGDRSDPQIERVAVGQLDHLGRPARRQPGRLGREEIGRRDGHGRAPRDSAASALGARQAPTEVRATRPSVAPGESPGFSPGGCFGRRGGPGRRVCVELQRRELGSRGDSELREDIAEMEVDRPRAEEELRCDLAVGQALRNEARDLELLRGQARLAVRPPRPRVLATRA